MITSDYKSRREFGYVFGSTAPFRGFPGPGSGEQCVWWALGRLVTWDVPCLDQSVVEDLEKNRLKVSS